MHQQLLVFMVISIMTFLLVKLHDVWSHVRLFSNQQELHNLIVTVRQRHLILAWLIMYLVYLQTTENTNHGCCLSQSMPVIHTILDLIAFGGGLSTIHSNNCSVCLVSSYLHASFLGTSSGKNLWYSSCYSCDQYQISLTPHLGITYPSSPCSKQSPFLHPGSSSIARRSWMSWRSVSRPFLWPPCVAWSGWRIRTRGTRLATHGVDWVMGGSLPGYGSIVGGRWCDHCWYDTFGYTIFLVCHASVISIV